MEDAAWWRGLADAPAVRLRTSDDRLRFGRFVGWLSDDPLGFGPTRGRARRWAYAAAGDGDTVLGGAVAAIGPVVAAFAFAIVDGQTVTWGGRTRSSRRAGVGAVPAAGARSTGRRARLHLDGRGGLEVDVPTDAGRLIGRIATRADVVPVVLATPTPEGGWNVTEKAAGSVADLSVAVGDGPAELRRDVGGWRDWTSGRQDRRTAWRWAAGAGHAQDGRRVGLNVSTGMNARVPGENVVWWDGRPHRLEVEQLAPTGPSAAGTWCVVGPGTELTLTPAGVRARRENLGLVRSDYTQPIGRWHGRLRAPDGSSREVVLSGVAEDHLAVW